jgi:hypothetical protein
MTAHFLDKNHKDGDIIDLVSDVDEVPQVPYADKSKGKVRAPDLGDIIELSD